MGLPGALLAAVAYGYSGLSYLQNTNVSTYVAVMACLPLAILGAELAIRSPRRLARVLWWGTSGLALSQVLASWLGQGSYYALLALGGYIAYRTLLLPPENVHGIRARFVGLALHGGAVLVLGFGLAAAGVLPRLEFNAVSNLAGGYPGAESVSGWTVSDWGSLLVPGYWYAGVTVLALALVAPLLARGRFAVPYFAALCLGALTLAGQGPTPLGALPAAAPFRPAAPSPSGARDDALLPGRGAPGRHRADQPVEAEKTLRGRVVRPGGAAPYGDHEHPRFLGRGGDHPGGSPGRSWTKGDVLFLAVG